MRVNNNLMAMNTHRVLGINSQESAKSIEKLSSGYRINSASDDAAGLAISEKMRAQVRGLSQASRNAQDGISMIQTAEGALQETHAILQRMRELSVQAANDTNVEADRTQIQKEINQLTEEVDRIANTTEFNTKNLLNGNGVSFDDAETIISNLKKWWISEAESLVSSGYGISASNIPMEVVIFNDPTHPAAALVRASFVSDPGNTTGTPDITGQGSSLQLEINLAFAQPVDATTDGGSYPQYVDRVVAHEMVHAVMMSTMNFGDLPIWFNEGAAEFIHGGDERLKNNIYLQGGGISAAQLDAGVVAVVNEIGDGSYSAWSGTSSDYSAAYLAVRYLDTQIRDNGGNGISDIMGYLTSNPTSNLDAALLNASSGQFSDTTDWISSFKSAITDYASLASNADVQLNMNVVGGQFAAETDTGSVSGSDVSGVLADAETAESILPQTAGDSAPEIEQPASGFIMTWPDPSDIASDGAIKLQIGANYGQSLDLNIGDMRASALGIIENESGIDVSTFEKATAAITTFNDAIEKVSSERSKLGALQNRLEHTIKNLDNSSENLQASESMIRDVDMASEMMQFTKRNILQQAAQAMLAQANQAPQSILQLLR